MMNQKRSDLGTRIDSISSGAALALLVTPILVAWRAPRDSAWRQRLFFALLLTSTYAATGMTQILFKHDIMDAFFIFSTIVIAASIPQKPAKTNAEGSTDPDQELPIKTGSPPPL